MNRHLLRKILVLVFASLVASQADAATYYVSHCGSNAAAGTVDAPWQTLSYAMNQLRAGDTLYLRGGTSADTNTACFSDGDQGGACWTETETVGGVVTSPLHWMSGDAHYAGLRDPLGGGNNVNVTVACYTGETCIVEPASGSTVVEMAAQTGLNGQVDKAHCSFIVLDHLILDARKVSGRVLWVHPKTSNNDLSSTMCEALQFTNSKFRHGKFNGGIEAYTYNSTYSSNEYYENGADITAGDNDQAIKSQGSRNTFAYGRCHHNLKCFLIETSSNTEPGSVQIFSMEIDHNGTNPWNGKVRNGSNGDLMLLDPQGSGSSSLHAYVTSNLVHDNAHIGISLGGMWGSEGVSYVDVNSNRLWSNGDMSNNAGCGPSIFSLASNTNISCSGNVLGP